MSSNYIHIYICISISLKEFSSQKLWLFKLDLTSAQVLRAPAAHHPGEGGGGLTQLGSPGDIC